jgi:N-acetylneuraminate epimerase
MLIIATTTCDNKQKKINIQWKQAATLPAVSGKPSLGYAGTVAGIIHDKIIIAGGANFPDSMPWLGGKKKYYDDVAVFILKDSSLELLQQLHLPDTIAYPAVCFIPDGIVYAGGENQNGLSHKVWLIKPGNNNDTLEFISLPALPVATTNASLTVSNNKLYFAGGETATGVSQKFYKLDLNNNLSEWTELADLPKPASHGLLIAQSGKIFFIGGRMKTKAGISDLYATVYSYNIETNQWTERKSLPYALSAGTGIAFQSDEILLFGGDKGETFHKAEELIAAIASEKDAVRKEELNQQKIKVQSTHPGFSREVLLYNTVDDAWSVTGIIPFEMPVTTTVFLKDNQVYIPSGEIRAGIRTPRILSGKFILTGEK